jgi:nicotinamidase/pyrazinamidase
MDPHSALLVVDVQNDFCAGGALAVENSARVVSALNRHIADLAGSGGTIYASRDWHPPDTSHFEAYGGRWPTHCVRDTAGARFHPELQLPPDTIVISKGTDPANAGYSAFEGTTPDGRPFAADLRQRQVDHLYVGGLATDYCVRHSVLDALSAGLRVTVLEDAVAGVDPQRSAEALAELRQKGAAVATLPEPSARRHSN